MSADAVDAGRAVPRTDDEIATAAARIGIPILGVCLPGVVANLAVLDGHAQTMLNAPAPS